MIAKYLPFFVFFVVFPAIWVGVAHQLAAKGWNSLLAGYRAPRPPQGKKIGGASASIGIARYNGVLSLWLADEGLYLQPMLLFRAFHPPLLVPWPHIIAIEENKLSKATSVQFAFDDLDMDLLLAGHRRADFAPFTSVAGLQK
jgi:hypothetical protein